MGHVVKLANLLQKHRGAQEDLEEYLQSLDPAWTEFVRSELRRSNETNSRNLGGHSSKLFGEDDDDNDDENGYHKEVEVNMNDIMAKFSSFNSLLSGSNADDDDDHEAEEISLEDKDHEPSTTDNQKQDEVEG
jgi:hypothetical protein